MSAVLSSKPKTSLMRYCPYPYQNEATEFIKKNKEAAIWLPCGLGKTIIVLQAINDLFLAKQIKGVLIVAPLRVARLTWETEIQKWEHTQWMRYQFIHGKDKQNKLRKKAEIYLINYEGLVWLFKYLNKYKPATWPFDMLVWDEITKMKSHATVRHKIVRKRVKFFHKRIGLTGTPIPNSYQDLWGQFYVLDEGHRLGPSFYGFRNRFFEPLDYHGYKWGLRPKAEQKLNHLISDITLRIGSEGLLDLHEPEIRDIDVELPPNSRQDYQKLEKELFLRLEEADVEAVNAAALTNKCLQYAGGAIYYDDEGTWVEVHRAKLEAIKSITAAHTDEPILIVYCFKHEAQRLKECLPDAVHWRSGLSKKVEQDIINKWDAGKIKYLIGHPASLGHGLNLQYGGRIGIWYTLNWSLELYLQTNKRLDRQGQKKPPLFYRLVTTNTVDEVVAETLRAKDTRQTSILKALQLYRDGKS